MEKRYDLSFMKKYAELFGISNRELANKFHCGVKIVEKILSGEYKIKEEPMEDILYEFGYNNYEEFKNSIITKINNMRTIQSFDYNDMNNTERIIISLLYDERTDEEITKTANFLKISKDEINAILKKGHNMKKINHKLNNPKIQLKNNVTYKTNTTDLFDYNEMNTIDRIIISLLCSEEMIYSIKQIAEFMNIDEQYIKDVYKFVLSNINYANSIEKSTQKIKTKE